MSRLFTILGCLGLLLAPGLSADLNAQTISVSASGSGNYNQSTGVYFGDGDGTLGKRIFTGAVALTPVEGNPLQFKFENPGRGTADETFQEVSSTDGSTMSLRYRGTVNLEPLDELGNFTATWTGKWKIAKGTGKFRGARGTLDVTAINEPFNIADTNWKYNWTWSGKIRLRRFAAWNYLRFQTGGFGTFQPANLGVGDPAAFPLVIGDGSGRTVYDGTPRGREFRLNNWLVFGGFDQHFGSVQSNGPGVPCGNKVFFPGSVGENPDGSGRKIHIMKTLLGQIWFEYDGIFEVDFVAGTINGFADLRIVGGTGLFQRSNGSVYVETKTALADVDFVDSSAPFRYDFVGYLSLW